MVDSCLFFNIYSDNLYLLTGNFSPFKINVVITLIFDVIFDYSLSIHFLIFSHVLCFPILPFLPSFGVIIIYLTYFLVIYFKNFIYWFSVELNISPFPVTITLSESCKNFPSKSRTLQQFTRIGS